MKNNKLQNANYKQISNPKSQISNKHQHPNYKFQMDALRLEHWVIEAWNLFGICFLGFVICLADLAFAVSPSEKQQLDNFKVSTLKGLRGVAVSVKIIRDDPNTLSLLKETQLAGIAEMTLQKAGIEILPPSPEVGLYVVLINIMPADRSGANIAMHVQSSLLQIVNLSRDITIKTEVQTWPSLGQSRFGVVSIAIAKSAIERAVKDQAITFAADFKAANPKPLTAETPASPNGYAGQAAEKK